MSDIEQQTDLEERILAREWFYEFELPSGRKTRSYLPSPVAAIHEARSVMLFGLLDELMQGRWQSTSCIDLACHEGFFAVQMAQRGCKEVLGIDVRADHVSSADLIRDVYGLDKLRFQQGDVQRLDAGGLGVFDIILLLGILYHLEDIVGTLRTAYALTRSVCVVETQIAPPHPAATMDWGSRDAAKEIVGCLAIVDESCEIEQENREANVTRISMVPSLRGLRWLLKSVGFKRVELLTPPDGTYEQFENGSRVMMAAYRD